MPKILITKRNAIIASFAAICVFSAALYSVYAIEQRNTVTTLTPTEETAPIPVEQPLLIQPLDQQVQVESPEPTTMAAPEAVIANEPTDQDIEPINAPTPTSTPAVTTAPSPTMNPTPTLKPAQLSASLEIIETEDGKYRAIMTANLPLSSCTFIYVSKGGTVHLLINPAGNTCETTQLTQPTRATALAEDGQLFKYGEFPEEINITGVKS